MTTVNGNITSPGKEGASLQELVVAKRAELVAQLRALETLDIESLLLERAGIAARLAEVDQRIAQVRVQVGARDFAPPSERLPRRAEVESGRSRMSSEEVRRRILKTLSEEKNGLSQLQIAENTSLAYGTVAAFLKANAGHFNTVGHLKSKRYFLK